MRKLLLASCLLVGLASAGARRARAQAPTPPGRYYLGLGGAVGSYALGRGSTSVLAPTLTGGLRITPRLALEAGLVVYHSRDEFASQGIYIDTTGSGSIKPALFQGVSQRRTQALSLAARYTVWQTRTGRLHLDALGGLALVHSDAYGYSATLDQATGQLVQGSYYQRNDQTSGCLLLGPSLRYQAGRRVELAAEFIANFAPGERISRFGRVLGTLGLSARYCFGPALVARP